MEFIEGKIENGINYNWNLIRKDYKKLGIPPDFDFINFEAICKNHISVELSERSIGKTTCFLLLGLVMNKLYGTEVQYVRDTEDELKPSFADKLVEVLKTYEDGRYIKALTNGRYNSMRYHWRKWYYCNVDEDGKETEIASENCIQCLSVEQAFDLKSSYNAPRGDIIIFDEFIGKFYRPNQFVYFMDLCKTIIRDRFSARVIMLANNVNFNSPYFEEMEISREVKKIRKGEAVELQTKIGTRIFVEYIAPTTTKNEKKQIHNTTYFGFANPKLSAITGGELWAFENVQHIPPLKENEEKYTLFKNVYIESGIELLQLEYVYTDTLGKHLEVHRATKTHEDSTILTLAERNEKNRVYGFTLSDTRGKLIIDAIKRHTVYFSSNEVGSIFHDFVKRYQLSK